MSLSILERDVRVPGLEFLKARGLGRASYPRFGPAGPGEGVPAGGELSHPRAGPRVATLGSVVGVTATVGRGQPWVWWNRGCKWLRSEDLWGPSLVTGNDDPVTRMSRPKLAGCRPPIVARKWALWQIQTDHLQRGTKPLSPRSSNRSQVPF